MNEPKVSVKIDKWDTWSMDHTLAHIVVPMLIQLKKTTNGCPVVDMCDRPEHLVGTIPKETHITDEFWEESWDWVLDEMLFAFESKFEDWEQQFFSGESDWVCETKENGNTYMTEGRNHTLTMDAEGMKMYQARISNGFRLFGKYYEGLWD
tara:strand:- start:673 stop:1125 length:453 start_codon:yes stop_codon:yes gene_type:complete